MTASAAEPDTLFDVDTLTVPPPPCHRCKRQPATCHVRVRPNLLELGPMWSWDLANGDEQARRFHASGPVCEPCGQYLAACWQISHREDCGQFRDRKVIWFVPLDTLPDGGR